MANPRALDKRRKSIKNIRKITRTMELIATAKFKRAMDRAAAATAYTRRMTRLVANLAQAGLEVSHPLLETRDEVKNVTLLVISANRGLCGGYNSNVLRLAQTRWTDIRKEFPGHTLEVAGKRGVGFFNFRNIEPTATYDHFEDRPTFDEVDVLASRFLDDYIGGRLDRLDVAYTRFESIASQTATVETLLPLGSLAGDEEQPKEQGGGSQYEFLPSAESILEEIVPTSFRIKLFKCFLDAAVSEQVARMVAMKGATENADNLIKSLTMQYNRARQSRITTEILDVMGGVEALKG